VAEPLLPALNPVAGKQRVVVQRPS
jgi:hypothetical protein